MNGSDYSTTTLPLLFVFISFVVTFLVTRLIRAGKGPFKDNVSQDGVHVRHAVYGIFALLAGAVMNTAAESSVFRVLGAILIGAGASLILGEFAFSGGGDLGREVDAPEQVVGAPDDGDGGDAAPCADEPGTQRALLDEAEVA